MEFRRVTTTSDIRVELGRACSRHAAIRQLILGCAAGHQPPVAAATAAHKPKLNDIIFRDLKG